MGADGIRVHLIEPEAFAPTITVHVGDLCSGSANARCAGAPYQHVDTTVPGWTTAAGLFNQPLQQVTTSTSKLHQSSVTQEVRRPASASTRRSPFA